MNTRYEQAVGRIQFSPGEKDRLIARLEGAAAPSPLDAPYQPPSAAAPPSRRPVRRGAVAAVASAAAAAVLVLLLAPRFLHGGGGGLTTGTTASEGTAADGTTAATATTANSETAAESIEPTIFSTPVQIPCTTRVPEDFTVIDWTGPADDALEVIWEDEEFVYTLSSIRSEHIRVEFADGTSDSLLNVLSSGRLTIQEIMTQIEVGVEAKEEYAYPSDFDFELKMTENECVKTYRRSSYSEEKGENGVAVAFDMSPQQYDDLMGSVYARLLENGLWTIPDGAFQTSISRSPEYTLTWTAYGRTRTVSGYIVSQSQSAGQDAFVRFARFCTQVQEIYEQRSLTNATR